MIIAIAIIDIIYYCYLNCYHLYYFYYYYYNLFLKHIPNEFKGDLRTFFFFYYLSSSENKAWKNSGPYGIIIHNLCDSVHYCEDRLRIHFLNHR